MVELGQVDIYHDVSEIPSFMTMPCEEHLEHIFQIFSHLKKYHNTDLAFDPSEPILDTSKFQQRD